MALLMGFSGAGFLVPAAFGHGGGPGQGGQQTDHPGPGGRGPDGQGPPGQGFGGGGGGFGPGAPQGPGNGGGPGNDGGPGNGGGAGDGGGPGNGYGHDNGRGNGQGNGDGNRGPGVNTAPPTTGPVQVNQAVNQGNGNGNGRGNGNGHGDGLAFGHGNGHGNGKGNGGNTTTHTAAAPTTPSSSSGSGPGSNNGSNRGGNGNGNGPVASTASATPSPAGPANSGASTGASASTPAAPAVSAPAASAAPATPTIAPTTSAGSRIHRHRASHRSLAGLSPTTAASTGAGTLGLRAARNGLSTSLRGSTASPNIVGALAPGTATLGHDPGSATRTATRAATANRSHKASSILAPFSPAATVIEHFINVIPLAVWLALAAALAFAAVAGVVALRSRHRMRIQAGEVAAVSAAAVTDPLTGVLNRRGFMESAEVELERAGRYGHPMALAFVDIRGLKAVNDSEGHLAGDRLLRRVTTLLRDSARTHDVVGRIGGDELAVLLAEQSAAGAAAMTQRVRAHVPAARSSLRLATPWDVTIGTATFPEDGDSLEELLAAADRRLYEQRGIQLA